MRTSLTVLPKFGEHPPLTKIPLNSGPFAKIPAMLSPPGIMCTGSSWEVGRPLARKGRATRERRADRCMVDVYDENLEERKTRESQ